MKTITLKAITDSVLPGLRAVHGDDDAALTKALKEQLTGFTVTGDDGKAIEAEFIISGLEVKAESAKAGHDEGALAAIVTKAMDAALAPVKRDIDQRLKAVVTGGGPRNDDPKMWGFRHAGEFGAAVINAVKSRKIEDERLLKSYEAMEIKASLTTFVNEGIGEEGGYAVPPDIDATIRNKVMGGNTLAGMCNQIPTGRNSVIATKDETTPWQSTGGVQAYWESEAGTKTQSKLKLKHDVVRLNKLIVLVPITDEAAEDAPGLINHINVKAPEKMSFKLDLAILQGTGAGQPLGILNSPAIISVAKVGSQVADTIVGLNIGTMVTRHYEGMSPRTIWIVNPDTRLQLETLMKVGKLDTGAADTGWGVTMPWTMYDLNRQLVIAGKPTVWHHAAETLGDAGDITLADMSQYDLYTKAGGIKSETSIHLWFDQDVTALRFVMRVAGQPAFSAPIQPRDGTTTYSPFVSLAERA